MTIPKRPVYSDPCHTYLCGLDVIEKRRKRFLESQLEHEHAVAKRAVEALRNLRGMALLTWASLDDDEPFGRALESRIKESDEVLREVDASGWTP